MSFLWLQIISVSLNANVKCKESSSLRNLRCLSVGSDSLYLQFKPTIWALNVNYPRKHTNRTISLQEHLLTTPLALRYTEKQQLYWNWATLPLRSSSLQPPKFNADKPTYWLGYSLWHLLKISHWTFKISTRRAKKCSSPLPRCSGAARVRAARGRI